MSPVDLPAPFLGMFLVNEQYFTSNCFCLRSVQPAIFMIPCPKDVSYEINILYQLCSGESIVHVSLANVAMEISDDIPVTWSKRPTFTSLIYVHFIYLRVCKKIQAF